MAKSPVSIIYDSGGTEKATAGNPLRTDPVGTTAQPVTDNGGSLTVDGSVSVSNLPAVQAVSDNGGSLTVDGTVGISGTVPVSAVSLPLPSGAATAALQTQPGVDIGDVTVNNGSGGAAVNIQDGGNSITVDGTVSVTTSGGEEATYTAIAQVVTVGNNKSMLGIFNPSASGYVLKLREIY